MLVGAFVCVLIWVLDCAFLFCTMFARFVFAMDFIVWLLVMFYDCLLVVFYVCLIWVFRVIVAWLVGLD